MILVDANLLVYAKFSDFPQHQRARSWVESQLAGRTRVGIPWESVLAFLRLATNARLFARPLRIDQAWAQASAWLAHPRVWIPGPTQDHDRVLGDLLTRTGAAGNLVADAHLAAIAVQHGLTICSADSDFARFPGVLFTNPLKPG